MDTDKLQQAVSEVKNGQAVLIDVRKDNEWLQGHAKEAIHFDSERILKNMELPGLNKDSKIYLYCRSGGRAGRVKNYLLAQGFTDVNSVGGLLDWQQASGEI